MINIAADNDVMDATQGYINRAAVNETSVNLCRDPNLCAVTAGSEAPHASGKAFRVVFGRRGPGGDGGNPASVRVVVSPVVRGRTGIL